MNLTEHRTKAAKDGEQVAAKYLTERGYQILATRWRPKTNRIEIDLVATRDRQAYVVEVKRHHWTGSGFEQILSWRQRKRLMSFAQKLHSTRAYGMKWGFLWIWVKPPSKCEILELVEFSG